MDKRTQLDDSYSLSKEQITRFREDGHILLRNVIRKEEVNKIRQSFLRTSEDWERLNNSNNELDNVKSYLGPVNLRNINKDIYKFLASYRFAKIASQLLGVPSLRIFRDFLVVRNPGDQNTPWHQDRQDPILDTNKLITMWMPLVDLPQESGTLNFITGTHKLYEKGKNTTQALMTASRKKYNIVDYGNLQAGDATFHAAGTIHSAKPNNSTVTRESVSVTYFADGAKINTHINEKSSLFEEMQYFFPGHRLGEEPKITKYPIIYTE